MDIFQKDLAALTPGAYVTLTDRTGRTISGIVQENDGAALRLQVTYSAVIPFSQIGMIEIPGATVVQTMPAPQKGEQVIITPPPVPMPAITATAPAAPPVSGSPSVPAAPIPSVPEAPAVPAPTLRQAILPTEDEIRPLRFDADVLKTAFRAMPTDLRKHFNPVYSTINSALSAKDQEKLKGAVLSLKGDIRDDDDDTAWAFLATAQCLEGQTAEAIGNFHRGGNVAAACRLAYRDAKSAETDEAYRTAAVYAAIAIRDAGSDDLPDAAAIEAYSALHLKDLSGLAWLLASERTPEQLLWIEAVIRRVDADCKAGLTNFLSLPSCLEALTSYCTATQVRPLIEAAAPQEQAPEPVDEPVPETPVIPTIDPDRPRAGIIVKFNVYEKTGEIVPENGEGSFRFSIASVTDTALRDRLNAMESKEARDLDIGVIFKHGGRAYGKEMAVEVRTPVTGTVYTGLSKKKKKEQEKAARAARTKSLADATKLLEKGVPEQALEAFKLLMDEEPAAAAAGQLRCYDVMWGRYGDLGYSASVTELLDDYGDTITRDAENVSAVLSLSERLGRKDALLPLLDELLTLLPEKPPKEIMRRRREKAALLLEQGKAPAAIAELEKWLRLCDESGSNTNARSGDVIPTLAALYLDEGDVDRAAMLAVQADEKHRPALLERLADAGYDVEALIAPPAEEAAPAEETAPAETAQAAPEEEEVADLPALLAAYKDKDGLDAVGLSDSELLRRALGMPERYLMLTYLDAAALLAEARGDTPDSYLRACAKAYSYAFDDPIERCSYTSQSIAEVFYTSAQYLDEGNTLLFGAAVLRALFSYYGSHDHGLEDLVLSLEQQDISAKIPSFRKAADLMIAFHTATGHGIDTFADYRRSDVTAEDYAKEAKECIEKAEARANCFETSGRVRYTRILLFLEKSELRSAIDIVEANDRSRVDEVRELLETTFIRDGREIDMENIDLPRLDAYIDRYWDLAADRMRAERLNVDRPHQRLHDPKRSSVVNVIRSMLHCLCGWVCVTEQTGGADSEAVLARYSFARAQLMPCLREIADSCGDTTADRAAEALRVTAEELYAKLEGTWDMKTRRFLFAGFLRSEEILLDENFLPELQSTFCGLPELCIFGRIERHAQAALPSLTERLHSIFSDDVTKNDHRAARLIRDYARETGDEALANDPLFEDMERYVRQSRSRVLKRYRDFKEDLELAESYGRISDVMGRKTALRDTADAWAAITDRTQDFGAFMRLLNALNATVAREDETRGRDLTRQLEELCAEPDVDLGIYPRERIEAAIRDREYTIAEHMMNCVRIKDVDDVEDWSEAPLGYLRRFMEEYGEDYSFVASGSHTVVDSILQHEHRLTEDVRRSDARRADELELTLLHKSENGRKDVRGGVKLLMHWIKNAPAGEETIAELLGLLGFGQITVTRETSEPNADSYLVLREKRRGNTSYPYPIPAFGSDAETEPFRVLCLYSRHDTKKLLDRFRTIGRTPRHTIVLLDHALNIDDRHELAKACKQDHTLTRTYIVIDRVTLFFLARNYAETSVDRMLMAITMPFAYYQPFIADSHFQTPPELFAGRSAELGTIEVASGANLVYGGRQLGKSALLKMAQMRVDGNDLHDRAVLVDITKLGYREAAHKVSTYLIDAGILEESCECDDWEVLARHIRKRLADEDPDRYIHYLLLMLDEADEFISSCAEVDYRPISELKNLQSPRFKIVMAGVHDLSRFEREAMLYNNNIMAHMSSVIVRPFRRPEATELLTHTLGYLGFRLGDERIVSLILGKTNYFPGLIQLYCQKLLESMKEEGYGGYSIGSTPPYEVTEDHIKKLLADKHFVSEMSNKLRMTLFVDQAQGSYYHIIALLLAQLYYDDLKNGRCSEGSQLSHSLADIREEATELGIARICALNDEQLDVLLGEMWDLNILSVVNDGYQFSTTGFRELLGTAKAVDDALTGYAQ